MQLEDAVQKKRVYDINIFGQYWDKTKIPDLIQARGVFRGGAKPPLDQGNLLISGGFQAPTGAEPPPLEREKNLSPTLDKFLNTPLIQAGPKHFI